MTLRYLVDHRESSEETVLIYAAADQEVVFQFYITKSQWEALSNSVEEFFEAQNG